MTTDAVKQSPREGDERRDPGGPKQPERRGLLKAPVERRDQHPDKPQPARSADTAAGVPYMTQQRQDGPAVQGKRGAFDEREALFNAGDIGTFGGIMVQAHEVTLVTGILIEIDGECLQFGGLLGEPCGDGFELYEQVVRHWLDNDPVLRKCEVRFSGRWLHCILWFAKPVEITSDRRRELWDTVIKAVQRSVPSDPNAPSLLAMTRPIGSTNSKTGRRVEQIKAGEPVTEPEVFQLVEGLTHRGFATVMQILLGATSISPCPFCREPESTLVGTPPRRRTNDPGLANRGSCYHCGQVTLTALLDLVLKGRDGDVEGDAGDTDGGEFRCEGGNCFFDTAEGQEGE